MYKIYVFECKWNLENFFLCGILFSINQEVLSSFEKHTNPLLHSAILFLPTCKVKTCQQSDIAFSRFSTVLYEVTIKKGA